MFVDVFESQLHIGHTFGNDIARAAAVTNSEHGIAGLKNRRDQGASQLIRRCPLAHPTAADHEQHSNALGIFFGSEHVIRQCHAVLVAIDHIWLHFIAFLS